MRRRNFIGVIGGAALALPGSAAAQQPGKIWRIGHMLTVPPEQSEPFARALDQSLADLGYVQGRNIVLLHRFAGAQVDKIEDAIISLVPEVDLLVAWGNARIPAGRADLTAHRELIIELANKSRLPAMYAWRDYVEAGGLMAYGADLGELGRRAATDVHEILNGGQTGRHPDLPAHQIRVRH
jgi:hypothetical protein